MGSIAEVKTENIPQELRERPQWVLWRYRRRQGGVPTKVPFQPGGRKRASVADPQTWTTFQSAVEELHSPRRYDGLGYVLARDDPYFFADVDDIDPDGPEAAALVARFGTYAERSPSGRGLHLVGRGEVPAGSKRDEGEIYCRGRFFTVTGDVIGGADTIEDAQDAASDFYRHLRRNDPGQRAARENGGASLRPGLSWSPPMEDYRVLELARGAKNGDLFERVYSGGGDFPSASERDLRLASLLSFFSQDIVQLSRLMRASGCARDKYRRDDYLLRTIDKAISELDATYSGTSGNSDF